MPIRSLYNFTSNAGISYHIQYDSDIDVVFVDATGGAPEPAVTIFETGKFFGTVLYFFCVNTTKVSISSTNKYPFAVITRTPNSTACGFIPGSGSPGIPAFCDFFIVPATISDETAKGEKDGTIQINIVLPFQTLEYSLDNIHWQRNKVFTNLPAGNYVYRVRSITSSCNYQKAFSILPGGANVDRPFPWTEKVCYFFELIRDSVEYSIEEPAKWDAVNIKGARDINTHGWKDQYSDEVIELEFDCAAGKEVLEAEYEANGSDGQVLFNYGYIYLGDKYILFPGKINFNTYKPQASKIAVAVESASYVNKFTSFIDTKVSLAQTKTLQDEEIAPPTVQDFTLHSKELNGIYEMVSDKKIDVALQEFRGVKKMYVLPDTSTPGTNEIEDGATLALTFITDAPYDTELPNWLIKYAGNYNFSIKYNLDIKLVDPYGAGYFAIRNYFMINDSKVQVGATFNGHIDRNLQTFPVIYDHVFSGQLNAKDEVYFFTEIEFTMAALVYQIALSQNSVNITGNGLETALASDCKGWLLFDTVDHLVRVITDNESYVKSDFLSLKNAQQAIDGGGSLYITTNGKQIRNFDPLKNPLTISPKDLLESIQAIFCLGYGFEKIRSQQVLRIERVNYFYRNTELLVIDEIIAGSWRMEVANDLLYNAFEVGYEKFKDEGSNTLDEFNTRHEGVTPIQTNKLKFIQKSKLITSGYTLEDGRRKQFDTTSTDSYANDEEGFLIAMRRNGSKLAPERNEAFQTVTGVISPDTAYNLRLSPTRVLLNWAIWLKNVFHYKKGTDKFKTTQVIQNGELTTQFKPNEPNPIGDINKDLWKENQEIDLDNYPVEERLWRPEWIYFKAKITPDKIQLINRAMKGNDKKDKNYGYLAVKDPKGLFQAGFIFDLDYNFYSEQATIKMLKKFNNPVTPGETCCNYLSVNGCAIKVNGQKIIL